MRKIGTGRRPWDDGRTPAPTWSPVRILAAQALLQAVEDAARFDTDRAAVVDWLTCGEGGEIADRLGYETPQVLAAIERRRQRWQTDKRVTRGSNDE